jgi:hypothetical protein
MIQEGTLYNLLAAANDPDNNRILNCLDLPMPWGSEERPPRYMYVINLICYDQILNI